MNQETRNTAVARTTRLRIRLLTLLATVALASCGGSDNAERDQAATAQATRHRLAVDTRPGVDTTALLGWAEHSFPALFPAGPANQPLDFGGRSYTVRHYAGTGNYLGVSGDEIFGYGSFTGQTLQSFGRLGDWACQVAGQACLSGTVAAVEAWAGAAVEARCTGANGATASARTVAAADGSYSLVIDSAGLPCAVRATSAAGQVMHSAAAGSVQGARSTVHVTPMTDATLAYAVGLASSSAWDGFFGDPVGRIAVDALKTADLGAEGRDVAALVKTAGVDFADVDHLFESPLRAGISGNAHGQALARLSSKLTGALTQQVLSTSLLRLSLGRLSANTAVLPAERLLLPAAPNCDVLRSGSHLAVYSDTGNASERVTIDAAAQTLTRGQGSPVPMAPNGRCRYQLADGQELMVSMAGVLVGRMRATPTSAVVAMLAVPEQNHDSTVLAGDWDLMSLEDASADNEGFVHSGVQVFGADGTLLSLTHCGKDAGKLASDCHQLPLTSQGVTTLFVRANADGGFDLVDTARNRVERHFAYRTGSGSVMRVAGGHLVLASQHRVVPLPTETLVRRNWALDIVGRRVNGAYPADTALWPYRFINEAGDPATQTHVRRFVLDITTSVTRPERIEVNRFLPGFSHRLPENVVTSDGRTQDVSEFLSLVLRGTGLTVIGTLGSVQGLTVLVQE